MKLVMSPQAFKNAFKKNIVLIVGLVVLGAGGGYGVSKYIAKPEYESSTSIIVSTREVGKDNELATALTQNQADVQLLSTYRDLLTSQLVLDQVTRNLKDKGYSDNDIGNLKKSVEVTNNGNSRLFTVSVKTSNAQLSSEIVNQVVSVFKTQAAELVSNPRPISIGSAAEPGKAPRSRGKTFLMGGAVLGLVVGLYIAGARQLFDPRITNTGYFKDRKVHVLGDISDFRMIK